MRPTLVCLFLAVGCAAEPAPAVVDITGAFERLSEDPASTWVGVESRQLTDDAGTCLLENELEAEVVEGSCDDCVLVLHVTEATEHPRSTGCDADLTEGPDVARNFAFRPASGDEGTVLVADEPSGPWSEWSMGRLTEGRLEYDHRSFPDNDRGLDLDDLRPLGGRPVQR